MDPRVSFASAKRSASVSFQPAGNSSVIAV
jgi:hypothetical protein